MASRSGARLRIEAEQLPALDGALESARAGVTTAGTRNNRAYAAVEVGEVAAELEELAFDPQTAGGLLISLPREQGMALEAEFAAAGLFLARIGSVAEGAGTELT
jgi:selenide,water dikinase